MPRSLWNGVISFALVTIPVSMVTAVRDKSIRLHMLSPDGSCRLRRKLYCPETGEEFDLENTARGYEVAPDQYVLIDESELERLQPENGRTIDLAEFVDVAAIDPIYFDKTYYLLPREGGARPYSLLVQAMEDSGKAAIARFVMRNRQHVAALRVEEGALLLHMMHYADEVTPTSEIGDELPDRVEAERREVHMASSLIEELSGEFVPEKYHDEYRERLEELIEAKAEGEPVEVPSTKQGRPGKVVNLFDALEESLEQARKSSGRNKKPRSTRSRQRKSA